MADSTPSGGCLVRILVGIAIAVAIYIFILPAAFTWWPPVSIERRSQQEKLIARVQSAGGWDAIRRDCVALAEQHTNGFFSHWHDTNLPPAIAALKPLLVQYYPEDDRVRMRIFGLHSTGGHSTPYFGLEVVTKKIDNHKSVEGDGGGVPGNSHSTRRPVADGVYEIY